jgi:hypothetical protein
MNRMYLDDREIYPVDPLTVIPEEPEPEPLPRRRDFALIVGAAAVLAIVLLLLVGGTRV